MAVVATQTATVKKSRMKRWPQLSKSRKNQSQNNNNKRGTAFSKSEIQILLLGIYEGLDNAKVADQYLISFPGSGRNKQSLKGMFYLFSSNAYLEGKVLALRSELLATLTANNSKVDKELISAHDFLMPWFVIDPVKEKYYYLHKKCNWKEIKVGYVGRSIRFQFVMDSKLWEGAVAEVRPFHMLTIEVSY